MKHLLGLLAYSTALFVSNANADGMPEAYSPPVALKPYSWGGAYVGAQAGGAWGDSQICDTAGPCIPSYGIDGALAGGTVGYNWQWGNWVAGVEADISWSDVRGSRASVAGFNCSQYCETELEWFGTARLRLGPAFDRFLPYVTGGLAYAKLDGALVGLGGKSATKTSWTVGGGSEYGFARNMSAKIEYLYVDDFDSFNVLRTCGPTCFVRDTGFSVVRAGLNLRFGSPSKPVPLK